MKITFDKKKGAEALAGIINKTSDASKKAIVSVQENAKVVVEKTKSENYARKLKKYNPIFPDEYLDSSFNLPNMIVIVDDAVRRGIDVCEGAIGWRSNENGMEVLHLYDEAVQMSGVEFVPNATCDAVYYVDSFDRNRFIRIDCIFSKAHEERLAELKHIAYSLGAKTCSIEISESSSEVQVSKKSFHLKENAKLNIVSAENSESAQQDTSYKDSSNRSGRIIAEFEGTTTPMYPTLKWFAYDDNIKRLIDMRCNGTHSIKSETIELSGASYATMSKKTAYAIDSTINKMGVSGSSAMESQATRENLSKLVFHIEF